MSDDTAWDKTVKVLEQYGPEVEKKLRTARAKTPKPVYLTAEQERDAAKKIADKALELQKKEEIVTIEKARSSELSLATVRAVRSLLDVLSTVSIENIELVQVSNANIP